MLKILNIGCTGFNYAAFAAVLVWLAVTGNPMIVRLILTCGVSFVVLSVFRHMEQDLHVVQLLDPPCIGARNLPMTMHDLAAELNLNLSTVSRSVKEKRIPFGGKPCLLEVFSRRR